MPFAVETISEQSPASLESDARRAARFLEKYKFLILGLLTIVYVIGALASARGKPLWYDEIITTVIASAPDAATTWKAAEEADVNPPLPHLLIHLSTKWFRETEVATRVPAIAGFWIFCLCLFRFTRRRAGIFYGLAALLLPVGTSAYSYAVEARGYGPELGFCGLALIAWQAAADGQHRRLALPGLALSLVGATLCHYYAVLLYVPLAGGEALRWYRSRKLDAGMWVALALGGAGLVWRAPVILGTGKWTVHSWASPSLAQVVEFWEADLQHSLSILVLLLAMLALALAATWRQPEADRDPSLALRDHELMAGALFLAIPAAAVAGALLVTHMFTLRYALLAVAGYSFLVPMVAAHISGGRALVGLLLTVASMVGMGLVMLETPPPQNPFQQEKTLAQALEKGPVVVTDGQLFLQMWYYAPERLKSRIQFIADDQFAIHYMGFDSIDEGLRVLRPWMPARVVDYRDFYAPGREFLIYQSLLRQGWLLAKVVEDGGSAEIVAHDGFRELIRIRLKPAQAE